MFQSLSLKEFFFTPLFTVHYLKKEDSEPVKLGITIAKKKVKRAVDRNMIKRRVREAFRQRIALDPKAKGYSFIFTATPHTQNQKWSDYEALMERILLNIFEDHPYEG